MAVLVQKFGGTSVADVTRIRNAARRVHETVDAGHRVAVVVSAMAGVTNRLEGYVNAMAGLHDRREYDVVVASGEQASCGLMALALHRCGVKARSLLGWQLPLATDDAHGAARILHVETERIRALWREGCVAVVAGFQGVTKSGDVSTLGRGGSDTSAVALAVALSAERCDIFTDVEGVFTADPRLVARARKLTTLSHEEMMELASLGSRVVQTRAVELAGRYRLPLAVRSSFTKGQGSMIVGEEEILERPLVRALAHSVDEAKITLTRLSDRPGIAAAVFEALEDAHIVVDMIVQNVAEDNRTTDLTFTIARSALPRAMAAMEKQRGAIGYKELLSDARVAKISAVGMGMREHSGVALAMFRALAARGINIQVISTSEIKISVLIEEERCREALTCLHRTFSLDAPVAGRR